MFQQRHFEAIAELIQKEGDHYPNNTATKDAWIKAFSDLFARHNPRFDRGRFERACVPGANVRKRVT